MDRISQRVFFNMIFIPWVLIVYKNWGPGQPSNHQTAGHKEGQDCADIGSQKFKTQWNDADCTIAHKFICERPARPPLK
ncbi:collectin-12, partial [Plakobranchus ocellatus]